MLVNTLSQLDNFLQRLEQTKIIQFDCETSGLNVWTKDRLCGIGFCLPADSNFSPDDQETDLRLPYTYYLPYRHQLEGNDSLLLFAGLEHPNDNLPLETLHEVFSVMGKAERLINHNIKFDMAAITRDGYHLPSNQILEDTMVQARLFFKDKHDLIGLENCSKVILDEDPYSWKKKFKDYLKRNNWQNRYDLAPANKVGEYCGTDCINTYKIWLYLNNYIVKTDQSKIWSRERELTKVLFEVESGGVYYDLEYCLDRIPKLEARLHELEQMVWAATGQEFNVGSPQQITKVFVDILNLDIKGHTPTGKPRWGVTELSHTEHPAAGLVLEYRAIQKVLSTYFRPLVEEFRDMGMAFASFRQAGTITGRMSCGDPINFQAIAKTTQNLQGNEIDEEALQVLNAFIGARQGGTTQDMTKASGGIAGGINRQGMMSYSQDYEDTEFTVAVKRQYIAPPDYNLYCIDFSQMEMRVFADYVQDPELLKLLEDRDSDFHTVVAKEVWKIDESHKYWDMYRTFAKAINFGLIYGIGIPKLANQIQKTEAEAQEFKRQYFNRFPKAFKFMKKVGKAIETRGYVFNQFGRRYYLPADKGYVAVNYLIQGTSADIVKGAMLLIQRFLKANKLRTRMVLQVHDELVIYAHKDEEEWVIPIIRQLMEYRQIRTLLPTDVSKGLPSWAQKKKWCTNCMCPDDSNKKKGIEHVCTRELVLPEIDIEKYIPDGFRAR